MDKIYFTSKNLRIEIILCHFPSLLKHYNITMFQHEWAGLLGKQEIRKFYEKQNKENCVWLHILTAELPFPWPLPLLAPEVPTLSVLKTEEKSCITLEECKHFRHNQCLEFKLQNIEKVKIFHVIMKKDLKFLNAQIWWYDKAIAYSLIFYTWDMKFTNPMQIVFLPCRGGILSY